MRRAWSASCCRPPRPAPAPFRPPHLGRLAALARAPSATHLGFCQHRRASRPTQARLNSRIFPGELLLRHFPHLCTLRPLIFQFPCAAVRAEGAAGQAVSIPDRGLLCEDASTNGFAAQRSDRLRWPPCCSLFALRRKRSEAEWIWSPAYEKELAPAGTCYFRKTFQLGAPEQRCRANRLRRQLRAVRQRPTRRRRQELEGVGLLRHHQVPGAGTEHGRHQGREHRAGLGRSRGPRGRQASRATRTSSTRPTPVGKRRSRSFRSGRKPASATASGWRRAASARWAPRCPGATK